MATVFSSLNERRREMAIFRAMGARPATIMGLLVLEAIRTATLGALLGVIFLYAALVVAQPMIDSAFGLFLHIEAPTLRELGVLVAVVVAGALVSFVPAFRAYRLSLADGMMVRT